MNRPRGFAAVLDAVDMPASLRADLVHRMGEPWRGYHGMRHLAILWARHQRYARGGPLQRPRIARMIAAAISYHDAILIPGAPDNEARSAALWRRAARRLRGFTPAEIAWVAETIAATADHLATPMPGRPANGARVWVLDLDLTPIGEEPTTFVRNGRQLRAEARHLGDAAWAETQRRFLARLGAAPRVLRHGRLHAAFEARARANIRRELGRGASAP